MSSRRTDLRPQDVVRCQRCRRLTERSKATQMNGAWYGPDCVLRVISSATADPLDR